MSNRYIDGRGHSAGNREGNRQDLVKRASKSLRDAWNKRSGTISDGKKDLDVPVTEGVGEPSFQHGPGGKRDYLMPGNKKYIPGDGIPRPKGGGGGRGKEASPDGEGEDPFHFMMSGKEIEDEFFRDLELFNMTKKSAKDTQSFERHRAGFMVTGPQPSMSVLRSVRINKGRRIGSGGALNRKILNLLVEEREILARCLSDDSYENDPILADEGRTTLSKIASVKKDIEGLMPRFLALPSADPDHVARVITINDEIAALETRRRAAAPAWIEQDLRYRRHEKMPRPNARAVMFCVMDVSGSMDEQMKDRAKRFYILLSMLLERKYGKGKVDIVFIRHTTEAEEVDEDTFFNSPKTGGTKVSSGLEEMLKVWKARYADPDCNIYLAQASDGDNYSDDSKKTAALLENDILPGLQGCCYLEVAEQRSWSYYGMQKTSSDLWDTYEPIAKRNPDVMKMGKAFTKEDVLKVFREFFKKQATGASPSLKPAAFGLG